MIAFPRGAATQLAKFAGLDGLAAIGLDTGGEPAAAVAALPGRVALQGNLDPLALIAGGAALDQGVDRVLAGFADRAHVFNLGHGILPETPIAHVERMLKRVRPANDGNPRPRRATDPRLARAARAWFGGLQQRIVAAMEALEREFPGVDAGARAGPLHHRALDAAPTRAARPAAAAGWRCCAGGCSRKWAPIARPFSARFRAEFATQIPGAADDPRFWAAGVSVIAHPWSPHVPTVHMNVRLVRTTKTWFGGGADLTPMLDARARADDPDAVAVPCGDARGLRPPPRRRRLHERFKAWCDEYFFLKHRNEPRGIGGIFFDRSQQRRRPGNSAFDADFAFVRDVGESFSPSIREIVRRNARSPWTPREREEQCVRRGRYVEFNLLYDRGTIFGLKTGGNVASILSSMPPEARWP